jgi:acetyl-CoA carboxylase biotin carboxyl carrier protein
MSDKTDRESEVSAPATGADNEPIADLEFVRDLIAAVDGSGIHSLDISRAGTRIRIAKSPPSYSGAPAPAPHHAAAAPPQAPPAAADEPATAPEQSGWVDIKSPMVGTFYRAPAPEAPSYVETGARVVKGQTLCILEAMKLMNELESDIAGVVREICVGNAEPVEYGQVLFRVEPEA